MKILVTGANGYLGQGVVNSLLDLGHEVIATGFRTDNIDKRAQCISVNLFEVENPYDYFFSPEVVLHLAWKDGFVHDSNSHLIDLPNHYLFLEKMIMSGVKDVVVLGTMHEIGFFEGSINANTPCNPVNLYGISKNALRRSTESLCKKNNAKFKWLRGYYIVGNSACGNSIFSKIVSAESRGEKEFPFTSGQNQYDFLDYNDFCDYVAIASTQGEIKGIINICSGRPVSLAERVEQFIISNGYKIKLKYGAFPDRDYDSKAVWGDDKPLRDLLKNKCTCE
jgi:dTDP-6-deoxy-L-talose 4-dehydrogenase (NAD+)